VEHEEQQQEQEEEGEEEHWGQTRRSPSWPLLGTSRHCNGNKPSPRRRRDRERERDKDCGCVCVSVFIHTADKRHVSGWWEKVISPVWTGELMIDRPREYREEQICGDGRTMTASLTVLMRGGDGGCRPCRRRWSVVCGRLRGRCQRRDGSLHYSVRALIF
jgi:hypothetical protein